MMSVFNKTPDQIKKGCLLFWLCVAWKVPREETSERSHCQGSQEAERKQEVQSAYKT